MQAIPGEPIRAVTPSGRTLAGAAYGPVDGTPVLFVAGAATGKAMRFGDDQLGRRSVRLLCLDRPGMGDSDPDPERTVASTAEDYRVFASAALGAAAPSLPVVANSQGSVFGLEIAARGWASSLTLVSPADEVAHPAIHRMLPAQVAELVDLVRDDPDAARGVFAAFTAEAMEQMVLTGSPERDRAVYEDPAFAAVYRAALAEGFANGGAGYVADTMMAMSPWSVDPGAVTCPVAVLFGADDRSHSPDLGETLAGRIPGSSRRVLPGEGGSLLWTRADLVLDVALGRRRG
ncbi:alpha/beta fold hydrolase [Agromyces aurantiacus]|uniref:Alpha/beta fold hydrolase n=1 Tax=Agromyces aurantiacus TaxID=165814 RepID=A0ABV9R6Y0_9MICO|nr:alpha/beta hydrolase [Agromyces aurantiacus]MBM7503907.1 pimeloyl-ACP methyl ester carboxylesterase [Agromyces aurantiacus]